MRKEVFKHIESDQRSGYHEGTVSTLYAEGDGYSTLTVVNKRNETDVEITFRNVSKKNPAAALQVSLKSYKVDKNGIIRAQRVDYSLPKEILNKFLKAMKTDVS